VSQAKDVSILGSEITLNTSDGIRVVNSVGVNIGFQVGSDPGAPPIATLVLYNGGDGVRVIGGSTPGTAQSFTTNVADVMIEGNAGSGVHLVGSSGNVIGGLVGSTNGRPKTWLGYSPVIILGHPQAGNTGDGVLIEGLNGMSSQNNLVADDCIAGNAGNGVRLTGPGTSQNTIEDNFIGAYFVPSNDTDASLTFNNQGNSQDGVAIDNGAHDNQVGGKGLFSDGYLESGAGNIIGNNGGDGVGISGPATVHNLVQGNMIGWADVPNVQNLGSHAIVGGNEGNGVHITNGSTINLVGGLGGTTPKTGHGNLISGNGQSGVDLSGTGTSSDAVVGNLIGTDPDGTSALPNFRGVTIEAGASKDYIGLALGGFGRSLGNLISGNTDQGVLIDGANNNGIIFGASDNVIEANAIGTQLDESDPLPNGGPGVALVDGAGGNTVGGANKPPAAYLPGNVISGNGEAGVELAGAFTSNNLVVGNLIGTDALGFKPVPNQTDGVFVTESASFNSIGGATAKLSNVISGNTLGGVLVTNFALDTLVENNEIGTSPDGLAAVPNGGNGVTLLSSGTTVTQNVISGNLGSGVGIAGSLNTVQGNKIGTDSTGTAPLANHLDGVFMDVLLGTGGNWIGGIAPDATNLISGNLLNGIHVVGPGTGNVIMGNRIGTDGSGTAFVPNSLDGVLVDNAWGYTIGGLGSNTANLISGNLQNGVEIAGKFSLDDVVLGNLIGTDPSGQLAVGNQGNGILIDNAASFNTIGGQGPLAGNLISGNTGDGILIQGGDVVSNNLLPHANRIMGNKIGTNISGMAVLANVLQGVEIWTAFANTIGGDQPGEGNLISGNDQDGILIAEESWNSLVESNLIGTRLDGQQALANHGNGIEVVNSWNNTIGGPLAPTGGPGSVISGNHLSGLVLKGPQSTQNTVAGNLIGTTLLGNAPLPNGQDGVDILAGASSNTVGGNGGVGIGQPGNVIACNTGDGVQIDGTGTDGNTIAGNAIGTYAPGVVGKGDSGNRGNGVSVYDSAQDNMIGGSSATSGNVIADNRGVGVAIGHNLQDKATVFDAVLSNSISDNVGIGIDLASDGVTPNTPGSPHTGPNNLLNTPVVESAVSDSMGQFTVVQLSLNASPPPPGQFTIQLFASPSPGTDFHGGGKTLLIQILAVTDINGNWTFVITLPVDLQGQYLSATTTDAMNDTSEFSRAYQVISDSGALVAIGPTRQDTATTFDGVLDPDPDGHGPGRMFVTPVVRTTDASSDGTITVNLPLTSSRPGQRASWGQVRFPVSAASFRPLTLIGRTA
jgi:hypothetical protein